MVTSRGRVLGVRTHPEMTCGFLNTVQSLHSYTKSAVSFDMYSQQFTYLCLVKPFFLVFAFLNLFTSPVSYAIP